MKSLRLACLLALLLFSFFAQAQVQPVKNAGLNMRGAYILTKQTIDTGTGPRLQNLQQWKIFTDRHVMFAHQRSEADSSAVFGIGTYKVVDGKVIEIMFHNSGGPANTTFELAVTKTSDTYNQVINFPDQQGMFVLSEDYQQSKRNVRSPLEGAWVMEKFTVMDKDGKATTTESSENAKQFKLYESGNFMWTNYWKDQEGKRHTSYGYGTFDNTGKAQITENNISSTYRTLLTGKQVVLAIKLKGKDNFEQEIRFADGSKRIEYYQRLK